MSNCSYKNCDKEVFENNTCIFHCDKSVEHWANQNSKQTKTFWKQIRIELKEKHKAHQNYQEYEPSEIEKIYFENYIFPIFEKTFIYNPYNNEYEKEFNFTFEYCDRQHGETWISGLKYAYIEFKHCTFYHANFADIHFQNKIRFCNCIFNKSTIFNQCKFDKSINFKECKFNASFSFKNIISEDSIVFSRCSNNDFKMIFSNLKCKGTFSLLHNETKSLEFNNIDVEKIFNIESNKNNVIELLAIVKSRLFNTLFKDIKISSLDIKNNIFKNQSNIVLNNLIIDKLNISNLIQNSNAIKLENITINKELSINSCELKNVLFNSFNLEEAKQIIFEKVSFLGANLNLVKWGKIHPKKFSNKNYTMNREIAQQIKHAYDMQGDHINANKFYSLEMALHKKELEKEGSSIENKLIFNLHSMVSNHGQSWILPLYWLFFIGLSFASMDALHVNPLYSIWFLGSLVTFSFYFHKLNHTAIKLLAILGMLISMLLYFYAVTNNPCIEANLNHFFRMIDPTSGFKSETNISPTLSFTCKLIVLYIAYQFITAVRKDTRRK